MKIRVESFTVHKRFALTISRGTTAQTTNVWVRVEQDGVEGWGEGSPFSIGEQPQTTAILLEAIQRISSQLEPYHPLERQRIEPLLQSLPSAARAAIDTALHDWLGKQAGLPLWKLWGLDLQKIGPTSVTIGINPPSVARERVKSWLELTQARAVKVKLGSPAGVEADRAMMQAVLEEVPQGTKLSIDANGGWTLAQAIEMGEWLADRGVTYIEQPLAKGQEADLLELSRYSPLPIFVDESCFTAADIPRLADRVQGINIKLMKSGGLTEVLKLIYTARSCGLQVMFGCYSDSSLANTAMAHLSPLVDHLDLDSHLNLVDDPFVGATLQDGCLLPNAAPGLGCDSHLLR